MPLNPLVPSLACLAGLALLLAAPPASAQPCTTRIDCVEKGVRPAPPPDGRAMPRPPPDSTQPLLVADSEASFWPDPVERTHVRLANLQHVIGEHHRRTGRLPSSLDAVFGSSAEHRLMGHDAWGNAILFRHLADGYELRSPGPDRVAGSADDLIATSTSEMPVFQRVPGERTRTVLTSLQMLVTLYESRTGALPQRLEDLSAAGLRPYLGTDDEWGRPIEFSRSGNDFELRSVGPDGRFGTDDDLRVRGRHPTSRGIQ